MSLLHVFFKSEFIVQYKRDQLYGIEDLVCKSGFAIFAHKMDKKYLGQKKRNLSFIYSAVHSTYHYRGQYFFSQNVFKLKKLMYIKIINAT